MATTTISVEMRTEWIGADEAVAVYYQMTTADELDGYLKDVEIRGGEIVEPATGKCWATNECNDWDPDYLVEILAGDNSRFKMVDRDDVECQLTFSIDAEMEIAEPAV